MRTMTERAPLFPFRPAFYRTEAMSSRASGRMNGRSVIGSVHILSADVFHFDNPNVRAAEGDVVPYKDSSVTVAARINVANDFSAFVGRDSPQIAQQVLPSSRAAPIRSASGAVVIVRHCRRISQWDVSSGGAWRR